MINKEIEEAKQKLEEFIGIFYEFPNPTSVSMRDYEVTAIETLLQYIDQLENKVKELEAKYEKASNDLIKAEVKAN